MKRKIVLDAECCSAGKGHCPHYYEWWEDHGSGSRDERLSDCELTQEDTYHDGDARWPDCPFKGNVLITIEDNVEVTVKSKAG